MAAQNGRRLTIKLSNNDSPETFSAIAGAVEKSFTITNGEIDITSDDDNGRMARLGGGLQDCALSVSGVTKNDVLLLASYNQTALRMQVEYEDTNTQLTGTFEIGEYEESGTTDNSAIRFSCSFRPTLGTWTLVSGIT